MLPGLGRFKRFAILSPLPRDAPHEDAVLSLTREPADQAERPRRSESAKCALILSNCGVD